MRFHDRQDAGKHLAVLLQRYRNDNPIILALPRGGVPVGYVVARALRAPLDVIVARKIGAPECPEYAIGAIAEGGAVFVEPGAVAETGLGEAELGAAAEREAVELARRVRLYRGDRPFPDVRGRTLILVDDGIATGRTARAAIRAVRERRPRRIVLAAPVVASQTVDALRAEVDDLVYVDAPDDFVAVGIWYERFGQTSDDEVVSLLAQARRAGGDIAEPPSRGEEADDPPPPAHPERDIAIPVDGRMIQAILAVPPGARGIVLFAHGSGSSRFSRRNRYVARALRDAFAGRGPLMMTYRVNAGPLPPGHWLNDPDIGGGRIIGEACHFIDLMSYLTGDAPIESVHADRLGRGDGPAEDVSAVLRFGDGSIGHLLYTSRGSRRVPKERLEVHGGDATALIDDFRETTIRAGRAKVRVTKPSKGHEEEIRLAIGIGSGRGGEGAVGRSVLVEVTRAAIGAAGIGRGSQAG